MKVLITGSEGFVAKNLRVTLTQKDTQNIEVLTFSRKNTMAELDAALGACDMIIHLAGENRPASEGDFDKVNYGLTQYIVEKLKSLKRFPLIVFSSSTQASLDNPYGLSKRKGEEVLAEYTKNTPGEAYIYRLTNVFGKWCKPNYNSAVATFMHNIARGQEITVSDPSKELSLVYVDDIVNEFIQIIKGAKRDSSAILTVEPIHKITLGALTDLIKFFKSKSIKIGDYSDPLYKKLSSTYLTYVPPSELATSVDLKVDNRGNLFELIKSDAAGQIFVSKTKPGITRGNHYHHLKVEKFCVIQGEAVIAFRHLVTNETFEHKVSGNDVKVVDIPPGVTHSILNTGDSELICLFWSNEIFDPSRPDTFPAEVKQNG